MHEQLTVNNLNKPDVLLIERLFADSLIKVLLQV